MAFDKTILVIDDELVMCEFLKDLLTDRGYVVKYTRTGREGLRAFRTGEFDAVITDLNIPDMDGVEVLKGIKECDPEGVVIVITGYPSFETVKAALRLGAFDYLTKPFNIDEICFILKKAVTHKNMFLANKTLLNELEGQNSRLEEKVRERTKELTLLYRIGRDMVSTVKLSEILDSITNNICKILAVEICSILLVDSKYQNLSIKAACGLEKDIIEHAKIKVGDAISGWVIKNKQGILVEDIETDPRFLRRNNEKYYTSSFISVPLTLGDIPVGVINVSNKKSKEKFNKDDLRFVKGIANEAAFAISNARLYSYLEETYMHAVTALTSAIDAKDHYTKTHSEHVTNYAVAIATEMGLPESEVLDIQHACQLHDLGKIGVHDYILTKGGQLTPEEWEEIRVHPLKSAEILRPLTFLTTVTELVEQHHEKFDGTGYPFGLKGKDIRLGARIIAVADTFDAMVTDRPYRKALPKKEAVAEIEKCCGTQFDPEVANAFLGILRKNPRLIED